MIALLLHISQQLFCAIQQHAGFGPGCLLDALERFGLSVRAAFLVGLAAGFRHLALPFLLHFAGGDGLFRFAALYRAIELPVEHISRLLQPSLS